MEACETADARCRVAIYPLQIDETGITWEETRTTRSGLFGRKSESVSTPRTVPLADIRNAKCSWSNPPSVGEIYYLLFTTAQGEDVILALFGGDDPAAAAEIWRDELREAVAVLRAYDIHVDDGQDLL
jgi:hypothetical protein